MTRELQREFLRQNHIDIEITVVSDIKDYHIDQVKEKWGELCWYDNGPRELHEIIERYEYISYYTCVNCGKDATHISTGWISPYCNDCVKEITKHKPNIKFKLMKK